MRLVLLSDTHGLHDRLPPIPDGDVLVHAGDLSDTGTIPQLGQALTWLAGLPHRHKVVVAGNHDWAFEHTPGIARGLVPPGITYLQDSGVVLDGVRFWGSPWQPEYRQWAFNLPRGDALATRWAQIPDDVQVLVTHGPPRTILDRTIRGHRRPEGCDDLLRRVRDLRALRLHVFGHVHEDYGIVERDGVLFANASSTTVNYEPVNAPLVVDL